MKTDIQHTFLSTIIEEVANNGLDGTVKIMALLFNEAMKIERNQALKALPYERTDERAGYANGFKPKTVNTRMGPMKVQIPQVRGLEFYPTCLEKGCRSERALKLAIAEMYVMGVSTRKVTEITEQLCGLDVTSAQVSRLTKLLDEELEGFRMRSLGEYPYIFLDARYEKVRHNNQVIDMAILIAIGVNKDGKREVLGVSAELSEAEVHWRNFLTSLKQRGLCGVQLFISDAHDGLNEARKATFSTVPWQRCQFHFAQNAQRYASSKPMRSEIAEAVRSIFSCNSKQEAIDQTKKVAEQFEKKAPQFATWIEGNIEQCLQVYSFPQSMWTKLRTVNPLELVNREVKRRTRVARIFPNPASVLRLVTAVLVEIHDDWITAKVPYLNLNELGKG